MIQLGAKIEHGTCGKKNCFMEFERNINFYTEHKNLLGTIFAIGEKVEFNSTFSICLFEKLLKSLSDRFFPNDKCQNLNIGYTASF